MRYIYPEGNFKPFADEFKEKKLNYMSYPNSQVLWAEFYKGYSDPEEYIETLKCG